ncbi:class I diterpene synthase 2, chloroplastic [Ricinus communis]|uniref:class I diterpene synthase 2, chloroplastic n=1 Tax=Ricinus communis TaxID=3988 RepID=UPI0007722D52|nr:class I diterpene synthase 2, chloroplastic [Ricinus communis]|eukprot:XP_015584013.1 acyclic sesquiterpene synthase [Ricinus communis]
MIYQKQPVLEKLEAWTGSFLKQQMLTGAIQDQRLRQEVNHALKYRYDSLDFLESRWVKDCRFDELKFARVLLLYCYYPNTALLVAPELADARLSLAKNFVLATVIDDFFDVDGSQEELENLIQLIERSANLWGETSSVGYCSEQFEIIFPHSKT